METFIANSSAKRKEFDDNVTATTSSSGDLDEAKNNITKKMKSGESTLKDDAAKPKSAQGTTHNLPVDDDPTIHQVILPREMVFIPMKEVPEKPAREYPFPLVTFQKEAIKCIENNRNVFVSAHASTGKTVIAEYAIASALRTQSRVIYTTATKARCNQKYREFLNAFGDNNVGLLTGHVTLNRGASCLVLTIEVLQLMLYRDDPLLADITWVIFDGVLSLGDPVRGVIWEETIMLLNPTSVNLLFLSTPVSNANEFAEWIAQLTRQPVNLIVTKLRPVPRLHYIWPVRAAEMFLVADDAEGAFLQENFYRGMNWRSPKNNSPCASVILNILERNLTPAIIFSFSRKEVETQVTQVCLLPINTDDEQDQVEELFHKSIAALNEEDRSLKQLQEMLPLLRRGVGIHHNGLLPLVKEMVEILFSRGLIKVLFATEAFANLGLPARTVVFTTVRKFDGQDYRPLRSCEYIKMSSLAGRRGLDERGCVVVMINERMGAKEGRELICGKPPAIKSAFHLTYSLVLNGLQGGGDGGTRMRPEMILKQSFWMYDLKTQFKADCQKLRREHGARKISSASAVQRRLRHIELNRTISKLKISRVEDKKRLAEELKNRKRVLRLLSFINFDNVITTKGRVALEISGSDNLLLSEMLSTGLFNDLNIHQIAALLSCFTCDERVNKLPKNLPKELSGPLNRMQILARKIAINSNLAGIKVNEEEYVKEHRPNFMAALYTWSIGQESFATLCNMAEATEGSIIRCMRRLEELLPQMAAAVQVLGTPEATVLKEKFNEAALTIKRDIVYGSLYL